MEFSSFGNSNTVLLVDDESDIVEINEQLLKRQGFNVFGFTNPQKALEDFQTNSRQYGLVISDIRDEWIWVYKKSQGNKTRS